MLRDGRAALAGAMLALALATSASSSGADSGLGPPVSEGPACTTRPSAVSLLQVSEKKTQPARAPGQPAGGALGCASPDLSILDAAYHGKFEHVDYHAYETATSDLEKFQGKGSKHAETYGEILPKGFVDLMCKVGARPGYRFYDLGSGAGKIVAIAWLLGMQAQGVELAEMRWRMSCDALGNLMNATRPVDAGKKLSFIRGSFLEFDFSDADLIFTDSVMFSDEWMHGLANIASGMREGARVITFKEFPGPWFKEIMTVEEPCSWSQTRYRVLERVSHKAAPKAATNLNHSPRGTPCSL